MLKSYQLLFSIALLFACFNLEATSFSLKFNPHSRRANATHFKPAANYQPWSAPRYNNTRPYNGGFNQSGVIHPVQSSPQYAAPYQGAVQQPNIGFSNNLFGSGTPFQPNGTYGFNAQPYYPNGTTHGNFNYTKGAPTNSTYPYARLFKFW
ncbi:uncharacterized protein LOC111596368 [Drosophila hydei]|uniref:Uncharacterized protein LOC111596368 n=1 Tax=Drosophila hydei TaxID=7224 RepID=A0A6J1LIS8_DROHY|nr:uncharacterized protein LOC111596368 [Drosophila hydei]